MSADRAATILARFHAAHHHLVATLRDLGRGETLSAEPAGEGWNAAQIGCHVAMTNEWIADVLTGVAPAAQPAPEGFCEGFDVRTLPPKLKTSARLEPPDVMGVEAAVERLRASGAHLSKAIASLSEERGLRYCVTLPFGTLSLFELAEFATSHIARHAAQVDRAVAGI
jgi:hypothetical protein